MRKLHRKSRVMSGAANSMDSVKEAKRFGGRRAMDILLQAQGYWSNMDRFRRDRERAKRYCYGDQWNDFITVDGETKTEKQYIMEQGNVALTNNLIRRLVRNVLGVYRQQATEPVCTARDRDEQRQAETMSTVLQCNMQANERKEVDARSMEEFLIGGAIIHRKWYGWRNERLDCWTDVVNPNNFFIDTNMRDFRGHDVSCLGEVHDLDFQGVLESFAKSPSDYERLRNIYASASDLNVVMRAVEEFGYSRLQNYDFLFVNDPTRCRVIEVWRKESKPRYRCHDWNTGEIYKVEASDFNELVKAENEARLKLGRDNGMAEEDIPLIEYEWFIDNYWYYYFLSPFGDILDEGETPYAHKSHPYVFKLYPFIDGEIHSFVSDVIDQQRYTNRLITMYDWIMRASAKGVLLFPEECLPANTTLDDIAEQWSSFNGVIAIKAKPGVALPQQVSNNATNIGISELLNVQLKFFEDISGVNGALQGKPGYSGTSGSLYAQQTQNATTSLLDLLDSFNSFLKAGAYKDVKNIQQFYNEERVFSIAGRKSAAVVYSPDKIRDLDFDMSIVDSVATPAYRAIANDFLMQLWSAQAITLEELLEQGDFPFADRLLQSVKARKEQMAQQQQMQQGELNQTQTQTQAGDDYMAQEAAKADPAAVAQLQAMLNS